MANKDKLTKMQDATKISLLESIEKWEGIVDGTIIDQGRINCSLCHRFKPNCIRTEKVPHAKEKCPVFLSAGVPGCTNTPYDAFRAVLKKDYSDEYEIAKAAQAELDFLISLLPSKAVTERRTEGTGHE